MKTKTILYVLLAIGSLIGMGFTILELMACIHFAVKFW